MFRQTGEVDAHSIYKSSFGDLPDKTVYEAPMSVVQPDINEVRKAVTDWYSGRVNKAASTNVSSGNAGYVPMPLAYDPDVIDITRRYTPIKSLLPKVTNQGLTANYFRVTARGSASWQSEDPALDEDDDTRELQSENIKFARVTGRVTGVAEIGGAHFESTMRREVMTKTQELNETIEDALVNGDSSTNSYQPDGLIKSLTANNTDLAGETPTLEDIDNLVNDCYVDRGAPNLLITDPYTATNLKSQIMNIVRYQNPYQQVAWGLQALSVNTVVGELPVVVSQFMPTDTDSKRVLCLNTNYVEQRVLQDITFERLAKTSDSEKFFIKTYMTLVNKFPEGMGQLTGCA